MHPKLRAAFERHVASTFDKQLHLARLVGENAGEFEWETGLLRFSPGLAWQAQLLGIEDEPSRMWQWAWDNYEQLTPKGYLKSARGLQKYGIENQILELTRAQFELGELNGEHLSSIAAGACHANGFYAVPVEGKQLFLLILDPNYPPNVVEPIRRISTVFPQFAAHYALDHRKALVGYLKYYGLNATVQENEVAGTDGSGAAIHAAFDKAGRLTRIGVRETSPAA